MRLVPGTNGEWVRFWSAFIILCALMAVTNVAVAIVQAASGERWALSTTAAAVNLSTLLLSVRHRERAMKGN